MKPGRCRPPSRRTCPALTASLRSSRFCKAAVVPLVVVGAVAVAALVAVAAVAEVGAVALALRLQMARGSRAPSTGWRG